MRHPTALPLLVSLLIVWFLSSCSPAPASPTAPDGAAAATAVPSAIAVASPRLSPTSTPLPQASPTLSPTSTPTSTETVQPSPSPVPDTPTPTAPPIQTPGAGDSLPMSLDWRFDANGHLSSGLLVEADGRSLFLLASFGRSVYALTEQGRVAWRLRTSGPVYALAPLGDSLLAAGDDAGNVTAFSATGRQLWEHALGTRVTALCGNWQGGLLAGGWDERLSFLTSGGELQWHADLDGPVSGIACVPGLALAATLNGEVAAFDGDGAEVWRYRAGSPITGIGTVGSGTDSVVILALQDGRLLALEPGGVPLWQQPLGIGGPVWQVADLAEQDGSEIVAGTGGDAPLLALLSAGGDILWRRALPSAVGALATLDLDGDGTQEILAGLASGQVQAYDVQGRLRGSVHAGLQVWGLHAAANGTVLVRADVVAWRVMGEKGLAGQPWLRAPAMVEPVPDSLPAATEREEGEAILVFLGDVSPGRSMEAQLVRYGPAYPWGGLAPLLHEADLAVASLESVLATRGEPLDKSYLIRAHPSTAETLVAGGFDLVNLANNHVLDFGQAALNQMTNTLQALDVATVGAGSSQEMARRPALFDLNGLRIAVLGYAAARWNGSVDVPATDSVAWAVPRAVQADVQAIRDTVDLVIVQLHAGTEYATSPSPDQVRFAHAAIDAGADLVVGHHPHVPQTVERYGNGLIVYSLGNALFDIPRQATMQGHMLRIHATHEGLVQAELWPIWIADTIQPRILDDGYGQPRVRIVYP